MPLKLTEAAMGRLSSEGKPSRFVSDAEFGGLMACVTSTGVKSFYVRWTDPKTGERRKIALPMGRWPGMPVAAARKEAQRLVGHVRDGRDPIAEIKTPRAVVASTLEGMIDEWAAVRLARQKESYRRVGPATLKRVLKKNLKRPPDATTRAEVAKMVEGFEAEGKPLYARTVCSLGSACFAWGVETGRATVNPFEKVRRPRYVPRERFLSREEVGKVYGAAGGMPYPFGPFVRLLVLTGVRREELRGMRWDELSEDYSLWSIPGARMKAGAPHDVPLPEAARAILREVKAGPWASHGGDSPLVFAPARGGDGARIGAFGQNKDKLDARSGVNGWTLHDLRRTVVTHLAEMGVPQEVADKLLAHAGVVLDSTGRIYQRHKYRDERAAALEKWADFVEAAEKEQQSMVG